MMVWKICIPSDKPVIIEGNDFCGRAVIVSAKDPVRARTMAREYLIARDVADGWAREDAVADAVWVDHVAPELVPPNTEGVILSVRAG